MADHATPWFPSENGASSPDGSGFSDVVAVLADAEFLLAAIAEEIERSRDFRGAYLRLRSTARRGLTGRQPHPQS
jgi:hypothetical protein